jgi:polygalacturonase
LADAAIQGAVDQAAAAGGGIVWLGAGDFKLSRHAGDETIVLKSGVTLRGQGYATHVYLDPMTPPQSARYYPVRIGTEETPASNVVVEDLRYTGNNAKIGGGSIMGFNARLGAPSARLLSSDNVTIRRCWIYDAQQAAGCCKEDPWAYDKPERQATQSKNWQVYNNYMDTCGNKMVEFADVNGGLIADNYIINAYQGPQVIFGSRNVVIRDNEVYYTDSGINISEGSHHIRVSGNHVEPMDTISRQTVGIALIFRTEPAPLHTKISDVVVTGNIFRNQTTQAKCTVRFQTRKEELSSTFEGITFTGNEFDGDVQFYDSTTPAHTTVRDILFADNLCTGAVMSVPHATMASSHVVVRGNLFRQAGDCVLNADQWIWSGNTHVNGTLQIATGAAGNVVRDNVTSAPIVDHGAETALLNNIVMPASKPGAKP